MLGTRRKILILGHDHSYGLLGVRPDRLVVALAQAYVLDMGGLMADADVL